MAVKTMDATKARLDRRTTNELRRFLEEKRVALMQSVRSIMGRRGDTEPEAEQAAQATETLLEEMDVALAARQSRQIAQIEAALERLGRHQYGLCRDCDDFIGLARLKALPFAQRCRPCQDRAERAERLRPAPERPPVAAEALAEAELV
jgi:DnaK suppressor protein